MQIITIFFGIMLFCAILNNAITSTVVAQGTSASVAASSGSPSPTPSHKSPVVRITSPTRGQQLPVGKDITISGTSIDNTISGDCKVSVRVNKVSPYQPTTASGPGGAATKDYSKWVFLLTSKYTTIKPGQNRITARFECANDPALRAFSSVNVNGVPAAAATGTPSVTSTTTTTTSSSPAAKPLLQQQQAVTTKNNNNNPASTSSSITQQKVAPVSKKSLSAIAPQVKVASPETNAINGEEQQQPHQLVTGAATSTTLTRSLSIPREPSSGVTPNNNPASPSTISLVPNAKQLSVSTDLAKDYVSRGDTQFITITVSNSTSDEKIAGADINADVHNANGLVKADYNGSTDSSGQASFSLNIGPRATPGLYAIEVTATASNYDPKSYTRVFEVTK